MSAEHLNTQSGPRLDVGVHEVLLVGDSFERLIGWDKPLIDPETSLETCRWVPVDFTGFVPVADLLDVNDVVLDNLSVEPSPGDDTGDFTFTMLPAQSTPALRDSVVRWRVRITFGLVVRTLVYARFEIT